MKRQTLLLALVFLAVAYRPSRPAANPVQNPPAEPGRIVGTVTRAGTADPLPEALVTVQRVAVPAASPRGPGGGGPRAGARWGDDYRVAMAEDASGIWSIWSWAGMPTVLAGARGGPGVLAAQQRLAQAPMRAITDAAGQFTIENIQPGEYGVNVQLEGYFSPAVVGAPPATQNVMRINVSVVSGRTTEVNFGLIPGGAIGGRVVDPRGRPVVDSPVQALRLIYQPDGSAALQAFGNRQTDDRGDYRLYRLPPGEYFVVATPRNLVTADSFASDVIVTSAQQGRTFYPSSPGPASSAPFVIRAGEEFTGANIQIRNVPLAKISGRVTHALPLEAFEPITAQRGQPAAVANLAPALAAAANDPALQPLVDEVAKAQAAVQAAQSAMQEARGRLQEARGLRGGNRGQPAQRALPVVQLQLVPRDRNALVDPNVSNRSMSVQLAPPNEGRFEMPNIPPGAYDLYASLPDNQSYGPQAPPGPGIAGRSFGRISIDVGDADVTDVTVTVRRGIDVAGRLVVDGRPVSFPNAHIVLQPDDSATRIQIYQQVGRSEAKIEPDGSFQFPVVPEGAYRVQVTLGGPGPAQQARGGALAGLSPEIIAELQAQVQAGADPQFLLQQARGLAAAQAAAQAPVNAYVADVRQDSVSIYDTGIVIGAGAVNPIDIYLQSNPGGITGTVMGAGQRPAANATVVLVPPPQRRRNSDLYRTTTTGADGKFTLAGVPPGEFKIFAWSLLNGTPYMNPSFLAVYEARGTPVQIFGGGQLTTEVPLILD